MHVCVKYVGFVYLLKMFARIVYLYYFIVFK